MNESLNSKEREYFERHAYWQNIAISHMSFSINMFLTISLAFLGFIVNSSSINNHNYRISFTNIDWSDTLIFYSVILGGLSIMCGISCVLYRIADFNLTRNTVYVRKKFYSENQEMLTGRKEKTEGNMISVILNTRNFLLSRDFIKSEDKDSINRKLANLIYWKELLGGKTWLFHKIQIVFFALMIIFWIISILIN
ncbi:MAG TPA: hypothetical protein VFD91_09535 [Mariniphaga sp.]|nr:hypothetical protein [Mariniphaga sp.]